MKPTPPMRLATWLLIVGLGACATSSPPPAAPPPASPAPEAAPAAPPEATPARVGGDRDEHGCIGSAGYSWCARENRCVRPWEVAREHGLAFDGSTSENARAFAAYCAGP